MRRNADRLSAVAAALAVALVASALHGRSRLPEPIEPVTVAQAAARIAARSGVRVVLLYGANCPYSRRLFPGFVELARQFRDVSFFAFSVERDTLLLSRYLGTNRLPFDRLWLNSWSPGELSTALLRVGIPLDTVVRTPQLVVIDGAGRVLAAQRGTLGLPVARAALELLRGAGRGADPRRPAGD